MTFIRVRVIVYYKPRFLNLYIFRGVKREKEKEIKRESKKESERDRERVKNLIKFCHGF